MLTLADVDYIMRSLRTALDYIDSPYAHECIARRDAQIAVLDALGALLRTQHAAEVEVGTGLCDPEGAAEQLKCRLAVISQKIEDAKCERQQMISGKPCSPRSVLG